MSTLTYDGHDFADLFVYGDPEFTWLDARPEMRDVAGRDGSAYLGMTYGPAVVSFAIGLVGDPDDRRDAISQLGRWLDVTEPKQLYLPDTPSRYYLAVPEGPLELTRLVCGDMGRIKFSLVDPIAYGQTATASLPSGGSVSITVGGTAPTMPLITASSAVRNSTSLVWGVRLDNADFVHVATGSSSSRSVKIDCNARTCTVTNAAKIPTLDSDWLVLSPGTHTLQMDQGTGAASVSWVERWY